ncbi:MAG: HD domain-containing protein [Bacilli bacterium]|jgi:3'-5' exoribonuclease
MQYIKEIKDGAHVFGQYLVINANKGVTNTSVSYLNVTLQDNTGTIEGRKWDASENDFLNFAPGNIVEIDADAILYKNILQLKILSGSSLNSDSIDVSRFVVASPVPQKDLEAKLAQYINSIKNVDCSLIVKTIVKKYYKDYIVFPAATRNHHDFACGLLFHTLSMADLAELISQHYPDVNRDLLLSGVLLHDLGKTLELSGPVIPKYTTRGKLVGHISIMHAILVEEVDKLNIKSEIPVLLEHMILSHHGQYEFGSPVLPLTKEALLLSMIDDMDAKVNILDKALSITEPGDFTQKIFALDDRYFYKPQE